MIEISFGLLLVQWVILVLLFRENKLRREMKRELLQKLIQLNAEALVNHFTHIQNRLERLKGINQTTQLKAKIAEKTADRALQLANAASMGVLVLQKSLPKYKIISEEQKKRFDEAKIKVNKLFGDEATSDWLRPILDSDELDVLEKAEEHFERFVNKRPPNAIS